MENLFKKIFIPPLPSIFLKQPARRDTSPYTKPTQEYQNLFDNEFKLKKKIHTLKSFLFLIFPSFFKFMDIMFLIATQKHPKIAAKILQINIKPRLLQYENSPHFCSKGWLPLLHLS